ncbi:MAG: zinc ABC transporter substrate-binding protein [Clostridia bacterium]|nr:zinc ABC transporter substrate-binding protein [Clostridia bacterium]
MNIKKIILSILAVAIVFAIAFAIFKVSEDRKQNSNKLQVVASNFASYDFLRAIIGENDDVELTFLLGPGKDSHSYEPTASDLVKIQNADLFVYVGGEMEKWSDKVLESLDKDKNKIICIADYVEKQDEEEIDGAETEEEEEEEEGAFDEHIWTSPENAIKMVRTLDTAMEELDNNKAELYKANAQNYIAKIKEVDGKIQEIVNNKKRDRLVFADKMPMQYFINYYKLKVSSAFLGCSTEVEPSAKTIAYLENKVKEEKIPVVLYIELNNGKVARTMANEIGNGTEAMQIQTLHNVSLDDFNKKETWISLMNRNLEVLKKALQ